MKINIQMGTEMVMGDSTIASDHRPYVKANVEITTEEFSYLKKSHEELFIVISRLINFGIQHMM